MKIRKKMKSAVNRCLGIFGKEIRATHAPLQSLARGLSALAPLVSATTIIDVGVADGTPELYEAFSGKKFILVEANPQYKERVKQIAAKLGAFVEMSFCGARASTVTLHLLGQSSSRYPTRGGAHVAVAVKPLDVIVETSGLHGPYVLKIDVEGAELEALEGAERTLGNTAVVVVELSFGTRPGAPRCEDTIAFLAARKFRLYNICEGGGIKELGRLGHADFIFLKV